jgi:ankyrin repeat protein
LADIHDAAEARDLEAVRRIISDDPSQVNSRDFLNDTPLHIAVKSHYAISEALLEAGADINSRGDMQRTPLHYAVKEAEPRIAALLCEKGAQLDLKDAHGRVPLYFAASVGDHAMVKVLIDHGAPVDIRSAVYVRGPRAVKELIEKEGMPFDDPIERNDLLWDAIRSGDAELVDTVIRRGADCNAVPTAEIRPLFHALNTRQSLDLVKVLLSHGADVKAIEMGLSVLAACDRYQVPVEVRQELMKRGAS